MVAVEDQIEHPEYLSWSMWGVAYAIVSGVKVLGVVRGNVGRYGRLGWKLDNANGEAEAALSEWRTGEPMVNGRALIDAHTRLVDEVRHLT